MDIHSLAFRQKMDQDLDWEKMMKFAIETNDAPQQVVMSVVQSFLAMVGMLAKRIDNKLPERCELGWKLRFNKPGGYVKDAWWVDVIALVTYTVQTEPVSSFTPGGTERAVFISVSEIVIHENGDLEWHSEARPPEAHTELLDALAKVITTGRTDRGHSYVCHYRPPTL